MKKIITILGMLCFASMVSADLNLELPTLNLPNLGGGGNFTLNSLSEQEQGIKILRKLRSDGDIIEDPELSTWIRSLGNQLTANAPAVATPYYFVISRDSSVNAFATLGGVIVINTGLILRARSESELAAVIAHEIAHITQRHIPRMIQKAKENRLTQGVVLLAGVLAGSKDAQAGQAIVSTAMATIIHKQLAFSRDAESEADRVGLRILATAGFNPMAMSSFLEKLERYGDSQDAAYKEFLKNHPLTLKRVSDTRIRAKRFGFYKGKPSKDFAYMQEKLKVLSNVTTGVSRLSSKMVKKYSMASWAMKRNNYLLALKIMGRKSRLIPEALLIGQALNKQRQFKQTLLLLKPLLDIYLGNEAISVVLAQAYNSLGQSDKAWFVLNEVNISEQTSLEFFDIKQAVARVIHHDADAYQAAAERNIRVGHYKSAVSLLHRGIRLSTASINKVVEMQALLEKIKNKAL